MVENPEIRDMKKSEFKEATEFHKNLMTDKRTPKVWEWEYKGINPKNSVLVTVKDGGEMVGTQGMIPIHLSMNNNRVLSGKSESTLLDPKYRGTGLYKKFYLKSIEKCREKGMQCLWGFTKILKAFKKVNYKIYNDAMKISFLPLKFLTNPREILKSKSEFKSFLYRSGLFCGRIYSIIRKLISSQSLNTMKEKYEISNKLKSPNNVKNLYKSLQDKHPNLINIYQDENYIDWRINKNPSKKIKTLFVYSSGSLVGYAYIKFGNRVASLIDFTFIESEVGLLLIKEILNTLNSKSIDLVTYTGNIKNKVNLKVFKLLRSFGFITIDSPTAFIIQNLDYPNEDILYDIKNWYITGIWEEGV